MADAQNERTKSKNRRRGRRRNRNSEPQVEMPTSHTVAEQPSHPEPVAAEAPSDQAIRPADIAPPTVRTEEYCVHHMASRTECEPMQIRSHMTTLRHLQVDHFGEATLYCDCLHNGPHEWPPSMQPLQTAIELDQFLAASTSEA